jgi:hypothetical protein
MIYEVWSQELQYFSFPVWFSFSTNLSYHGTKNKWVYFGSSSVQWFYNKIPFLFF